MPDIDREGIYRGKILEYGLREEKKGAIGVKIKMRLLEQYQQDEDSDGYWSDIAGEFSDGEGVLYLFGSNGQPIDHNLAAFTKCAGWDGNLSSIADRRWVPKDVQCVIKADEYKGKVRCKINFINAYDSTPGGQGNVSAARARELQQKHAGDLAQYVSFQEFSPPMDASPQQDESIPF